VDQMASIAAQRAIGPTSVQMMAHVTIAGGEIVGRWGLDANLMWREPGDVRLRLNRPPPVTIRQFLQCDGWTTILYDQEGLYFRGPTETLDPSIRRNMPTDASSLVAVPLIDEIFAQRLPDLRPVGRPEGSCWRRHTFLRGDPSDAEDPWWRTFEEEIWAIRPDTLTVEGLALRLPPMNGGDSLWLWITLDAYTAFDVTEEGGGVPSEEGLVLPSEFRLALVERPWRRWRRGEIWSVSGEVNRILLNRRFADQVFDLPPPRGAEIHALWQLRMR
ncbi:hypothetical protein JXA47_01075, partial [Candidatus Sumerlaeota bacterium]|nr:hypothetical protein [Candidatus Sumerlaeota bacterium]